MYLIWEHLPLVIRLRVRLLNLKNMLDKKCPSLKLTFVDMTFIDINC